ncbi:MAG: DUF309 domain-containing protein [Candidatus Methylomirabilis sp.]|nr:DUF309 domain-containing protein [Deltaproteobacteria bacterium]
MAGDKRLDPHAEIPPLDDPATLRPGVELFNRGEFYACHDYFEELWVAAPEPEKSFLQGLILASVGFFHITRGNYVGATRQWRGALARLERPEYQPRFLHVDVEEFVQQLQRCNERLLALGPQGVRSFDFGMTPYLPLGAPRTRRDGARKANRPK